MNKTGQKEGPLDLVTVMRRVKAGKILPDTWVYVGDAPDAAPAHQVEALRSFFNQPASDMRQELAQAPMRGISVSRALRYGWHFTSEHQHMPVLGGAILLFSALVGMFVHQIAGPVASTICAGIVFMIFQSGYFVLALRAHRGQPLSMDFLERQLSPIGGALMLASLIFSVLIGVGLLLVVVPGVLALLLYILVPIIIFDRHESAAKAISTSATLLKKLDRESTATLAFILALYIPAVALLIPIPLVMPVLAGAVCSIYDELLAA